MGTTIGGGQNKPAGMAAIVQTLSQRAIDEDAKAKQHLLERFKEVAEEIGGKATSYQQVVLGLGYVGFFTFWSGSQDVLLPTEKVASALAMCISLSLYILFEVRQMYYTSTSMVEITGETDPQKFLERFDKEQGERDKAYARAWQRIYPFTLATGLIGAGILMGSFVVRLIADFRNAMSW